MLPGAMFRSNIIVGAPARHPRGRHSSVPSSHPRLFSMNKAIGHRPQAAAIRPLTFGPGGDAEPTGPVRRARQGDGPPRPGADGFAGRGTRGDAFGRRLARIDSEGGTVEYRGRLLGDCLAFAGGGVHKETNKNNKLQNSYHKSYHKVESLEWRHLVSLETFLTTRVPFWSRSKPAGSHDARGSVGRL